MTCETKRCIVDVEMAGCDLWDHKNKIICIGVMDVDAPEEATVFYDDREEQLLLRFLQYFNRKDFKSVIGYNISHDIRALLSRALRYNIPARGLYAANPVDLMMILKGKKYNFLRPGTLNEWSRYLFSQEKMQTDDCIPVLYKEGKIDQILQYNRCDLQLIYQLWKRVNFVLEA